MTKKNEVAITGKSFEEFKQFNEHGAEYWSARSLQAQLGYSQWRRFEQAIERAISSCKESGNPPENHFAGAGKMVGLGSGSERQVDDYQLSRFACYLPSEAELKHELEREREHALQRLAQQQEAQE